MKQCGRSMPVERGNNDVPLGNAEPLFASRSLDQDGFSIKPTSLNVLAWVWQEVSNRSAKELKIRTHCRVARLPPALSGVRHASEPAPGGAAVPLAPVPAWLLPAA